MQQHIFSLILNARKKTDLNVLRHFAFLQNQENVLIVCGYSEHKPNLCVVQKVSEHCMDRAIIPESICASCGTNERVFSGMDTSTEFCRWLFSEEKFGSSVFAHNFQSYQSIPIMTYLCENAILPKVITTDAKFLSVEKSQSKIIFF